MSLESLTPEEQRSLRQAQDGAKVLNELLTHSDPDVRKSAQRLAKKARPDLRFPELEAHDAEERARAAAREENEALRKDLEQEKAARLKAEEIAKITSKGFDPEMVYKAMESRGIVNLDTALSMFEAEQQLGESSSGNTRPMKLPKADVPPELVQPNGAIDVEGLRSHLIDKYYEESGQKRVNPLGFLRQ
jgi:hypothetical protein